MIRPLEVIAKVVVLRVVAEVVATVVIVVVAVKVVVVIVVVFVYTVLFKRIRVEFVRLYKHIDIVLINHQLICIYINAF